MTVKDAIGPLAYSVWQWIGYGVFIISGWFILFALCRAARDAKSHPRTARLSRAPQCRLVTLVRNADRTEKTVLVFPGADRANIERWVTL